MLYDELLNDFGVFILQLRIATLVFFLAARLQNAAVATAFAWRRKVVTWVCQQVACQAPATLENRNYKK